VIGADVKQEQDNKKELPDNGVNYVDLGIAFFALAPELVLHDPRSFGVRSVGPRALGTLLSMYLFASSYTYSSRRPLLVLTALIALLAIVAQISAVIREGGGRLCHSRYNGRPWAIAILPMSEARMKRCEPLLLVLCGWGLHHLNYPLGSFVITAGACYGVRVVLEYLVTRRRTLDLKDAMAEQSVAMQAMNRIRRG
jgi:hypothetical protein